MKGKSRTSRIPNGLWNRQFIVTLLFAFALAVSVPSFAGVPESESERYTVREGTGEQYETVLERETIGELSQEDYRQVTLLGSRLLLHLNNAAEFMLDEKTDQAREEIGHAQRLSRVIRDMLPVTKVHTVVHGADGEKVYEYSERVQDELIPIYEATIMTEIVRPIVDARQEDAAVQGLTLEDADFIHTSALLDLGYVDRKLNRALALLDEGNVEDATQNIVQAQLYGLDFQINEDDSPLAKAQAALRLAERMVGQNRPEAAKMNLQLARIHLESYEGLVGEREAQEARELRDKIAELSETIGRGGMATETARGESRGIIRGFWDTVTGWMSSEPGEVQPTNTTNDTSEEQTADASVDS